MVFIRIAGESIKKGSNPIDLSIKRKSELDSKCKEIESKTSD